MPKIKKTEVRKSVIKPKFKPVEMSVSAVSESAEEKTPLLEFIEFLDCPLFHNLSYKKQIKAEAIRLFSPKR